MGKLFRNVIVVIAAASAVFEYFRRKEAKNQIKMIEMKESPPQPEPETREITEPEQSTEEIIPEQNEEEIPVLVPVEPEFTEEPITEEPVNEETKITEEPVIEEPVNEETKITEEPVTEEPVNEEPEITEEPVTEEPVNEEPEITEEPVTEEPVNEEPKITEEPVTEEPVNEEPDITEEPVTEEPVNEEPEITEEPVTEEPVNEEPEITEEPVIEEPVNEEPEITEEPVIEEPIIEEPEITEEPVTEEPVNEEPEITEEPVTEEPVNEEPEITEEPVTEEPVNEEPEITEEPVTEEPVNEEPEITEEPVTEEPVNDEPETVEDIEIEVSQFDQPEPVTSKYEEPEIIEFENININPEEIQIDFPEELLADNQQTAEVTPENPEEITIDIQDIPADDYPTENQPEIQDSDSIMDEDIDDFISNWEPDDIDDIIVDEVQESLEEINPVKDEVEVEVAKAIEKVEEAAPSNDEAAEDFHGEPEQPAEDAQIEVEEIQTVQQESVSDIINQILGDTEENSDYDPEVHEETIEVVNNNLADITDAVEEMSREIDQVDENDIDNIINSVLEGNAASGIVDNLDEPEADPASISEEVQRIAENINPADELDDSISFDSDDRDMSDIDAVLGTTAQQTEPETEQPQVEESETQEEPETVQEETETEPAVEEPVTQQAEVHQEPVELLMASYPHLSRKVILKLIGLIDRMMSLVNGCKALILKHTVQFENEIDYKVYKNLAISLGYSVNDLVDKQANLYNTVNYDRETITTSILTLAETLTAYRGSYKGWTIVDVITDKQ